MPLTSVFSIFSIVCVVSICVSMPVCLCVYVFVYLYHACISVCFCVYMCVIVLCWVFFSSLSVHQIIDWLFTASTKKADCCVPILLPNHPCWFQLRGQRRRALLVSLTTMCPPGKLTGVTHLVRAKKRPFWGMISPQFPAFKAICQIMCAFT